MEAYTALHRAGHAHSVEAWLPCADGPDTLVGGVYGVAIGSLFSAESMFCRPELGGTDAGKVCLAHLVRHVHLRGFTVLDVQIANGHTAQFGVREIPASRYRALLAAGVDDHRSWGVLDGTWPSSTALPPDCGGPT
jgi:leucyl/phenylalanyl-tRNA--protein transferase